MKKSEERLIELSAMSEEVLAAPSAEVSVAPSKEASVEAAIELSAALFSKSMGKAAIMEIAHQVVTHSTLLPSLYALTLHPQTEVAWRALWACQWVCEKEPTLWIGREADLIERTLQTDDSTQQRLLLRMLWMLPVPIPLPVELLDFCLEAMVDAKTAIAVQALCMKVAFKLCLAEPELLTELRLCLESMEPAYYTRAVQATRTEILKKIEKEKRRKKSPPSR
ncbi:MAG: hypothetical protein ACRCUJ_03350 [Phocaeicola sp.]